MRLANLLTWITALVFGALAPAVAYAVFAGTAMLLPIAFAITLAHAVVLGLPIALVYRVMQWTRLYASIIAGFLIGAVPLGILAWPMDRTMRTTASSGGVPTIVDGIPTWAGWLQYIEWLGLLGAHGALGGLIFWLVLRWTGRLESIDLGSPRSARRKRFEMFLAGAAICTSAAIAAMPSITKDRTCHNAFRSTGSTTVSSRLNIDLDVTRDDWPRLTQLFGGFAASHGMSFRNDSRVTPNVVDALYLSMCTEAGVIISIVDQRWAARNYEPLLTGSGILIHVYDVGDGTKWISLARLLVARLESEWPGKARFRDGMSQLIPAPEHVSPLQ